MFIFRFPENTLENRDNSEDLKNAYLYKVSVIVAAKLKKLLYPLTALTKPNQIVQTLHFC